jgi:hypothetical protein
MHHFTPFTGGLGRYHSFDVADAGSSTIVQSAPDDVYVS